jgi:hypothetical protein
MYNFAPSQEEISLKSSYDKKSNFTQHPLEEKIKSDDQNFK